MFVFGARVWLTLLKFLVLFVDQTCVSRKEQNHLIDGQAPNRYKVCDLVKLPNELST